MSQLKPWQIPCRPLAGEDRHRWWIVALHQDAPKGLDGIDVPIGADVLCLRCRYVARDLSGGDLMALLWEDGAANLAQWSSMMRAFDV